MYCDLQYVLYSGLYIICIVIYNMYCIQDYISYYRNIKKNFRVLDFFFF